MRVLSCDPETQIIGAPLHALLTNRQADEIRPLLEKHGLTDIQADLWYSARTILDVMNDITSQFNSSSNLVALGMEVGEKMSLPPELANASLPHVLMSWNTLYQHLHRYGRFGHITAHAITPTHYETRHVHIYSDDFQYGITYAFARRFLPRGTHFTVYYDPNIPTLDAGGEVTIIHIKWETLQ